jgi:hypothetical protein
MEGSYLKNSLLKKRQKGRLDCARHKPPALAASRLFGSRHLTRWRRRGKMEYMATAPQKPPRYFIKPYG